MDNFFPTVYIRDDQDFDDIKKIYVNRYILDIKKD